MVSCSARGRVCAARVGAAVPGGPRDDGQGGQQQPRYLSQGGGVQVG